MNDQDYKKMAKERTTRLDALIIRLATQLDPQHDEVNLIALVSLATAYTTCWTKSVPPHVAEALETVVRVSAERETSVMMHAWESAGLFEKVKGN